MNENDDTADLKQSVTIWIGGLKEGSADATEKLWERYFDALVRQAQRQLGNAPRRIADEEDVAVSVFDSLCSGAAKGNFKRLQNRDDLWKLLVVITRMKAVDQVRRQSAQKRGGQNVHGDSLLRGIDGENGEGFDKLMGTEPTPELLMEMEEQQQRLMNQLTEESHRRIAGLRLQGFSNQEIADQLEISIRSVERKIKLIRDRWVDELE